jgi:hypothetical protein
MRRHHAPFYLRRTTEALISFPDPMTGEVKKLFTKREVRTASFELDGDEYDFYDALTRYVEDQSIKASEDDSARGRALSFTMAMLGSFLARVAPRRLSLPGVRSARGPSAHATSLDGKTDKFGTSPCSKRSKPILFQHHVGGLQSAFHPTLRVGIRLAANVKGLVFVRLNDALLDLGAADPDVPAVPAAAKRVVAPVAEGRIADLRRVVEPVNQTELPIDFSDHRLGGLIAEPWVVCGGGVRGPIGMLRTGYFETVLPGHMAPRPKTVPKTNVGSVVVACHEHRGTFDGRFSAVGWPIVSLADRKVSDGPSPFDGDESSGLIGKTGSAPPGIAIGREEFEERSGRHAGDKVLNAAQRGTRGRQQIQRAARHRERLGPAIPAGHSRPTAAKAALTSTRCPDWHTVSLAHVGPCRVACGAV